MSSSFDIDQIGDGFCCDRTSSCAVTYTKRLSLLHKRSIPFILPTAVGGAAPDKKHSEFDSQTLMTEVLSDLSCLCRRLIFLFF